jgi:ATP-dependent Clp protease ATP-binding subunit ClpX
VSSPRPSRRPGSERDELAGPGVLIRELPSHTPREIVERIHAAGYLGQAPALKAAALMAYRHVSRLRSIYVRGVDPLLLPPKSNLLFVGPTGCGKTFLVEILFREVLALPTVIVDMTNYSETGYVGLDVASILTRLLYAANLNPVAAQIGVVCLDEFDKLASGHNNAVFAGAGTTKDVTGIGVQRELLRMLEGADVTVPIELTHSDYAPRSVISTRDIPFVACGAFSGLKGLIERRGEHIGFGRESLSGDQDRIAVSYTDHEVDLVRNFTSYGFLPELIARFKRVIPFAPLGQAELEQILDLGLLPRYGHEFAGEGKDLVISLAARRLLVSASVTRETGARGLESALIGAIEEAAFEAFSSPDCRRVEIVVDGDRLAHRLG